MNRVAIMIGGEKNWLTAPIIRKPGLMLVNEVQLQKTNWREKAKKTLQTNYGSCRFFREIKDWLFSLIDYPADNLSTHNINTISEICKKLVIEFKRKSVLSSELNIQSQGTERLIKISKSVGCSTYMSGGGSAGYQNNSEFDDHHIKLIYQNFKHPVYEQCSPGFVAGLSIIDAICNIGIESVANLLNTSGSSFRSTSSK